METLKKNFLFVVGLVIIGGIGLYWLVSGGGDSGNGDENGLVEQPSQYAAVRAEILATVAILQAVQLDISVLDDPAFRSLSEVPHLWENEPFKVGNRNPFLPIP